MVIRDHSDRDGGDITSLPQYASHESIVYDP